MSRGYTRKAENVVSIVQDIVRELRVKNVPFMAGSIAYSAFVSLFPLVVLLLIAASVLGGQALMNYILETVGNYLTPAGQTMLLENITAASGRAGLSALGIVVLLWGVLRVFRTLDIAFSTIYGTQGKNDLLNQFRDGIVVLLALGVALLVVIVAVVILRLFPQLPFLSVLNPLLLIGGLTIVFVPLYYVFPDTELSVREVLPGAVVGAVGWTILEVAFEIYVAYSSTTELYGVIGGIILFVTWLYFGALVILIGAVTNVVLAKHALTSPSQGASER